MTPTRPNALNFSAHGILIAIACNMAGWGLSLVGQLAPLPLLITIPLLWLALARLLRLPMPSLAGLSSWKHRMRQPLPLLYLCMLTLILAGGLIHAPNNYDALNYRIPRIAHWLIEKRWEWIHSANENVNTRACGFEWISVPLIALTRTDRFLFLINFICFLSLPSHTFGFLRGIGVSPRVTRTWMWILPAGYGFALQAASIGNDLPAACLALAACHFGFRAKMVRQSQDLQLALLAAGLMTAIKPTTLPLLLPIALIALPSWRELLRKPVVTLIVCACGAIASFLPNAIINQCKGGDWTGAAIENPALGKVEPLIGLSGNFINITLQNLTPPVFPIAPKWNAMIASITPTALHDALTRSFETNGANLAVPDFQGEEWAGLGLGVTLLVIGSCATALLTRTRNSTPSPPWPVWLWGACALALIAYFTKAGMSTVGRHVLPYYIPLLAPLLLISGHARLVRSKSWMTCAIIVVLSTLGLMIITPSRPLWPASAFFQRFASDKASPFMKRVRTGYEVYGGRADALGSLRDALPNHADHVGYINFAPAPQASLWKPYLKRQLIQIIPNDSPNKLSTSGITHIVLNTRDFETHMGVAPASWMAAIHGRILSIQSIRPLVKEPASDWWVIELIN